MDDVAQKIESQLALSVNRLSSEVRIVSEGSVSRLSEVVQLALPYASQVTVGRASLEDVFVAKTGRAWE